MPKSKHKLFYYLLQKTYFKASAVLYILVIEGRRIQHVGLLAQVCETGQVLASENEKSGIIRQGPVYVHVRLPPFCVKRANTGL
jgi:hypothetical protein